MNELIEKSEHTILSKNQIVAELSRLILAAPGDAIMGWLIDARFYIENGTPVSALTPAQGMSRGEDGQKIIDPELHAMANAIDHCGYHMGGIPGRKVLLAARCARAALDKYRALLVVSPTPPKETK